MTADLQILSRSSAVYIFLPTLGESRHATTQLVHSIPYHPHFAFLMRPESLPEKDQPSRYCKSEQMDAMGRNHITTCTDYRAENKRGKCEWNPLYKRETIYISFIAFPKNSSHAARNVAC